MRTALLIALALAALPAVAFAGVPPPGVSVTTTTLGGVSDNRVGIGLRFEFGDNAAEVVGSARHTYTDTSSMVTGAQAEIAVPIIGKNGHAPKIRALGLAGSTCVQGQAGIGFDFGSNSPFLAVGVHGPYIEGGFSGDFKPYVGINSYGCAPDRTATTTTTFVPVGGVFP